MRAAPINTRARCRLTIGSKVQVAPSTCVKTKGRKRSRLPRENASNQCNGSSSLLPRVFFACMQLLLGLPECAVVLGQVTLPPTSSSFPTVTPVPTSTPYPTGLPSASPSPRLTSSIPSQFPTATPRPSTSFKPSHGPSRYPTHFPTITARPTSTPYPTNEPSRQPTDKPTEGPTASARPSPTPSNPPTPDPTHQPSPRPSRLPSVEPSPYPTSSTRPSRQPSVAPTGYPSVSFRPSSTPSISQIPTLSSRPTGRPSPAPTSSFLPSMRPSSAPSDVPTHVPSTPPTVSLTVLNETNIQMQLSGVLNPDNWTLQVVAAWSQATSAHVYGFWRNFTLGPFLVTRVQTLYLSHVVVPRIQDPVGFGTTLLLDEPARDDFPLQPAPAPIVIDYFQSVEYGVVTPHTVEQSFPEWEKQLFEAPFSMNSKPYVETLQAILNQTYPILVDWVLVEPAPPPSPATSPDEQRTSDRNTIIAIALPFVAALIAVGGYILYLMRKERFNNNLQQNADNHSLVFEEDAEVTVPAAGGAEAHPGSGNNQRFGDSGGFFGSIMNRRSRHGAAAAPPPRSVASGGDARSTSSIPLILTTSGMPTVIETSNTNMQPSPADESGTWSGASSPHHRQSSSRGSLPHSERSGQHSRQPSGEAANPHDALIGRSLFSSVITRPISVISAGSGWGGSGTSWVNNANTATGEFSLQDAGRGESSNTFNSGAEDSNHSSTNFTAPVGDIALHPVLSDIHEGASSSVGIEATVTGSSGDGVVSPDRSHEEATTPHLMSGFMMQIEDIDDM